MSAKKDLRGQRFGKLLVLEEDGRYGTNVLWKCKCDCGNTARVRANSLLSGNTTTCGCGRIKAITIHNATGTPLFDIWRTMKERCNNKTYKQYCNYGGRGIKVCDEWMESFKAFEEWSLKNGYKQGLSIDRIDVNGNYEPSNCRWATRKQQARNKQNTVYLEYKGEKLCLAEWAERLGKKYNTLSWRYREGWSVEEILFGRA